jgi:hypothetical protein
MTSAILILLVLAALAALTIIVVYGDAGSVRSYVKDAWLRVNVKMSSRIDSALEREEDR